MMRANPISIIVFLCGAMSAVNAWVAWRHRATRGSRMFFVFMSSLTVYLLGYSMELASLDLPTMLFWSKIGYLGIFSFPTLFLMFVLQYTGRDKWLKRRNILLLFLIPTLLLIAKFTDDIFHLVYSSAWVDTSGLIPLLGFTRGPIYLIALYSSIPVTLGVILLWQKRQNTPPLYQKQATLIAVSAMTPLLVFIIYMGGFQPFSNLKYLDLNAFMYTLWGIGIGWAMFRYRLFELAPIARDALIEHLSDGVFVLDDQSRLVDANPVALKFLGWSQPPIGQYADQAFSTWKDLRDGCQTTGMVDPVKIEIQHVKGSESVFFDINITALHDEMGRGIGRLIVIHDITERKQLEEQLRELSLVDELTGLSNRRGFYVLATQLIHMAERMNSKAAVIFADMDGMKSINDTFGHAEGDQALVDTANLLRSTSRSSDILARLGGDEFVILAIETNDHLAEVMLDRLKSQLEAFNTQESRKYPISVSFGVAHYDPEHPSSVDEVMVEADKAMYEQKQAKNA
ncbi:MAG TPA: histidine kinase N-terminal 7TM domain-containing protein, partial [Anaerolineaceae bacterium]